MIAFIHNYDFLRHDHLIASQYSFDKRFRSNLVIVYSECCWKNKQMEQEKEFDIFLCHNGGDKSWVQNLAESIENETYNDRNLKVFFDDWDVIPGENLVLKLEYAMQRSRYVGVILSKNSINAEWPTMEWTMAVYNDPSGRKGFVIPLWLGNCEIPPSLKIRHVLYCRNDIEFRKSYKKLIAFLKNEKLPRGKIRPTSFNALPTDNLFPIEYADEVEEQIASNLLPVLHIPRHIWNGPVSSTYKEVFDFLGKNVKGVHPTFMMKENLIYSFCDLTNKSCPFQKLLIANSIEKNEITPWLNNLDKKNGLIEMLNRALRNHCHNLEMRYDKKHDRFYFLPYGGGNREITWHTGERKSTRTIVKQYKKGKDGQIFWAHQSIQARFLLINTEIFLQLVPGWTFTSDGANPISPRDIGSLSSKWTHNEYNSSVFYHIRFWCYILSKGQEKISIKLADDLDLDVDITPAVGDMQVGIDGDQLSIEKVFEVAEIDTTEDFNIEKMEDEEKEEDES